jgi:hypothetical protein
MRRNTPRRGCAALLMLLLPVIGRAQTAAADPPSPPSRTWVVVGAGSSTVRGDCQTCEEDSPYRSGGSILGNVGYRLNPRADIGAEILWVPVDTQQGQIRATHFDAIAQVRPWSSHGFFLKGGAGMAFIRNWIDAVGPAPINSKALSIVIGGGWAFRTTDRIGFQVFASQHAGAIGDLQTASGDVPDVMGNFWTIGAAIVFR